MTFQPNPGDGIVVNGTAYTVGQHPAAPGVAYAQAGRQGIVYQLLPVDGELHEAKALKVFFPKFRIPAMVYQSEHMGNYREIPGLQVSSREVLTPERNGDLIAEYPDLLYAVIMPWIHGCTWFDVISDQRNLGRSESLMLAKALAAIGSSMEQRGLAHCDLSAPNVMLPFFSEVKLPEGAAAVELVDVEQMYSPKMDRPDVLLAGSPGYAAHRTVHSGLWSAYADRFAGAVIIAEMLGWSDPAIVNRAWGESYFDQHEMQTPCERYFLLKKSLGQRWGTRISDLFGRTWDSQDLSSCPTFGEWLIALSSLSEEEVVEEVPAAAAAAAAATAHDDHSDEPRSETSQEVPAEIMASLGIEPGTREVNDSVVGRLFHQARDLEDAGNLSGALEIFRSAYHFVKKDSPLEVELAAAIQGLEEQLRPAEESSNKGIKALLLSRKFMLSAAAAIVILAGSAITVNQILAEKAESRQLDAQRLAEQQAQEKEAAARKQEEETRKQQEEAAQKEAESKKAEEERLKAEEAKKAKEAEQTLKEQEKAELQAKYEKQAKYEAYLASLEEKKKKQVLQEKYDNQVKYEAYLAQMEEKKKKAAQEAAAAKAEAERQAKARAAQEAQAAMLQKQRSQNVVELVALYNKAYNAQVAGNKDRAKNAAREFIELYNNDKAYYKTVGKMSSRLNNLQEFISNDSHWIPKL
ncbi:hypothetical protein [Paenibacillus lautus]|uniref:hypothetical protein n=1 Tax=Paenibacillus lautus TaxID=1401 RepID=UPI003D2B6B53